MMVQTDTMPMGGSTVGGATHATDRGGGGATTQAMDPHATPLRRGASIFFKESARMLEEIFEFLYLGQIAKLEENEGKIDPDEYNVWMFLLTWCARPRERPRGRCTTCRISVRL